MESFLIHWGYAAVFLFGFLVACCLPIPSAITFAFAGALAGEGYLNIVARCGRARRRGHSSIPKRLP